MRPLGHASPTYKAEVVFGVVCPLGTQYKSTIETLKSSLKRFGYSTNLIHISESFPDLLQELGEPATGKRGSMVGAGPSAPAARVPLVSRPAVTARGGMLAMFSPTEPAQAPVLPRIVSPALIFSRMSIRGGRAALPAGNIGAKGCELPQGGPPPGNEFGAAPAKRSADLGPWGPLYP